MDKRCKWAKDDLMIEYHDREWGLPLHDDRALFEFLILEGAQAGLSWSTILKRRKGYQIAFNNFDASKVAAYGDKEIEKLMQNTQIIRNRLKINSTISGAKALLEIQKDFGSFNKYIWGFVNDKPIINNINQLRDIPTFTRESEEMSKDLKKRGFNFVGPTICYAFMQAIGMVNDHEVGCFRWEEVQNITIN
ncbi:MAG TPA: DNA-3-methyladenine glycosylase I [Candidatus Marinimicrobia bacterium]|jgi:DNA-3-methyladenine glycosylase I|nr:DNA-3-methyladenine glycosylase I [Candidatus Neomarinimicrobiota bacterium]